MPAEFLKSSVILAAEEVGSIMINNYITIVSFSTLNKIKIPL